MSSKIKEISFKAKSHLLKLLGDELIGNDQLAIFELVKNGYDADASYVDVTLDVTSKEPSIIVEDIDGNGMTFDDIENKWLLIGTDSKRGKNKVRTKKYNRMPLGEKGVGRLAVHKLGESLQLNTRSINERELEIKINWPTLINDVEFIDQTQVSIKELETPKFFKENTGTRIKIYDLYKTEWNRNDIRKLKKMLVSLNSPFSKKETFTVNFNVPGRESDLINVLDIEDILELGLWEFKFHIDDKGMLEYEYIFNPPSSFSPVKKSHRYKTDKFPVTNRNYNKENSSEPIFLKEADLDGIGPIYGSFYVFSLQKNIIDAKKTGVSQQLRSYLKENGGMKVFRDGIRVFNYGEPGDDWLRLNSDRVNNPGKTISNNTIIGEIDLDLERSSGLIEKTNREGFTENNIYEVFHWICENIIDVFLQIHQPDRDKINEFIKSGRVSDPKIKFDENINKIREVITKNGLNKELDGRVDSLEKEYNQMRNVMTSSGLSGLNISVIFHEVEREIDSLHSMIMRHDSNIEKIRERSTNLMTILESFSTLLKKRKSEKFEAKEVIKKVFDLCEHRFRFHKTSLSAPILSGNNEDENFYLNAPFGIIQAAITNIVNNSLYWSQYKREISNDDGFIPGVGIFCRQNWYEDGPAIIIADNGTGFSLPPENAVQPFIGSRPGGMGLGLYYAKTAMESIGGKLIIESFENMELPPAYNGAVVSLIFKGNK
ncbi:ATP-binding protein [Morganella sp. Je.2.23]|uniref:ATP-binding protein n=1 Tax=Morganella sp. Je.2.23 TaxID=3142840 RepID=UPI003DAA2B97